MTQTFAAGAQVQVSVPSYSSRKAATEQTMTVERVTAGGALRLSDGKLYRFDPSLGAFASWRKASMGIEVCAKILS